MRADNGYGIYVGSLRDDSAARMMTNVLKPCRGPIELVWIDGLDLAHVKAAECK